MQEEIKLRELLKKQGRGHEIIWANVQDNNGIIAKTNSSQNQPNKQSSNLNVMPSQPIKLANTSKIQMKNATTESLPLKQVQRKNVATESFPSKQVQMKNATTQSFTSKQFKQMNTPKVQMKNVSTQKSNKIMSYFKINNIFLCVGIILLLISVIVYESQQKELEQKKKLVLFNLAIFVIGIIIIINWVCQKIYNKK